MIPYLLAAVGGYLIGDSMKKQKLPDNAILADGGEIESTAKRLADNPNWTNEKLLAEYNKNKADLVSFNAGELKPSKVIGGGYKSSAVARRLAKEWLEKTVSQYKMALEIRGAMAKGGEIDDISNAIRDYYDIEKKDGISRGEIEQVLIKEKNKLLKFNDRFVKDSHSTITNFNEIISELKKDGWVIYDKYAKGGNVDDDLENFDISQLDAYESMQYNHFIEKSKLSKKEALKVIINSVDEDYSQLNPKLSKIAKKYRIGGEINKGDKFYYTKSGKKEFAVVEEVEGDNIKIFINHPESHNKGKVYSKDKHITVPRQDVRNYGTPIRTFKMEFADGGDISVASTILQQLGGQRRLNAMTGAYNFYDIGNGVSFKIKNPRANYIKIKLNGKDLYDVEVGRVRGTTYKIVAEQNDVYFDQLKNFIEKATGMYLSL